MSMNFAPPLPPLAPGAVLPAAPTISLLTYASAAFSGNVTMTNANTFYDGATVTVTVSGTYLLMGSILIQDNVASSFVTVKLWDGTTTYAAASGSTVGSSNMQYTLFRVVQVGITLPRTFKLSAASTGTLCVILAAAPNNSPGNYACVFNAIRLGP